MSFLPVVSTLNDNGEIHCAYMPKPITVTTASISGYYQLGLSQMEQAKPYYYRQNMKSGEVNMRKIPSSYDTLLMNIEQL